MRSSLGVGLVLSVVPVCRAGQYASCASTTQLASESVVAGDLRGAEARLLAALPHEEACVGAALSNLAALNSIQGQYAEAERLARRSVELLEQSSPPSDRRLLRPLQILSGALLDQGKVGAARKAYQRLLAVQADGARDRALVHGIAAALFTAERRAREAESEYLAGIDALREGGQGESAYAGTTWNGLAVLYLNNGDLVRASEALERALAILAVAKDTVSTDRIRAFTSAAAIYIRQKRWGDAERVLGEAVALADREPQSSLVLSPLLDNYAFVLRKVGRRRDAAIVVRRLGALGGERAAGGVVDVTELRGSQRTGLR